MCQRHELKIATSLNLIASHLQNNLKANVSASPPQKSRTATKMLTDVNRSVSLLKRDELLPPTIRTRVESRRVESRLAEIKLSRAFNARQPPVTAHPTSGNLQLALFPKEHRQLLFPGIRKEELLEYGPLGMTVQ